MSGKQQQPLAPGASVFNDANEAASLAAKKIGDPAFEEKLEGLSPEQIQLFLEALRLAMRKRKLMLYGYLCALASLVLGLGLALLVYATREPGTFVGWVFVFPFGFAGGSMWLFGRLAERIKIQVGDLRIESDADGQIRTERADAPPA